MANDFTRVNVVTLDGLREKVYSENASLAYIRLRVEDRETYDAAWHVRVKGKKGEEFMLVTTRHIRSKTYSTLEQLYKFHVEVFGKYNVPLTVPIVDEEYSPEHKIPRTLAAEAKAEYES